MQDYRMSLMKETTTISAEVCVGGGASYKLRCDYTLSIYIYNL